MGSFCAARLRTLNSQAKESSCGIVLSEFDSATNGESSLWSPWAEDPLRRRPRPPVAQPGNTRLAEQGWLKSPRPQNTCHQHSTPFTRKPWPHLWPVSLCLGEIRPIAPQGTLLNF